MDTETHSNFPMEKITERLQKAIGDHVFPGCVLGIVKRDGTRQFFPIGHCTYADTSPKVTEDTIYDLASITKSIAGASSLLKLIDQGKLQLEDRLVDFVPAFGNFENKKDVQIKHILTYTLSLDVPSMWTLKDKTPDTIINIVSKAPLRNPPGCVYWYTNSTALFIGLIVEKITGKRFDVFVDEHFFTPLGMHRTTYHPEKINKEDIAPTEIDEWRGRVIQGEVHDESTFTLQQKYVTAIAGLFSTAPDLLDFLEMLLHKGVKDRKRYFSEEIVTQMHTNQLGSIGDEAGLGWVIKHPETTGTHCSDDTFSKTGFTGTIVVVDPIKGVAFTLLSNRTYPKRTPDTKAINEVRRDIAELCI